jgi:lipopolysaccharide transport system ATP-binding protein
MSEVAIKVEGLSKRYRIGAQHTRYRTLKGTLNSAVSAPLRALRFLGPQNGQHSNGKRVFSDPQSKTHQQSSETIWALKDVSLEIKSGEVVGIIGRNGAGKSTLLKILSRITEPTEGYADVHGRVASLLEVGTGFQPELTGRENTFLNGSILGMKRAEIKRRFDEIVTFAEVEKFIDTPVKYYSSGMYVRLAFGVAAHLDPEILLVDEVLAVGDAAFQKKCLGKMSAVAKEGRTVLFVSHNMAAVRRLCDRGICLADGAVGFQSDAESAIDFYNSTIETVESETSRIQVSQGEAKYTGWQLTNTDSGSRHSCYSRELCEFRLSLALRRPVRNARLGFAIQDLSDQNIVSLHSLDNGGEEMNLSEGNYEIIWKVRLPIREGTYRVVGGLGSQTEGQLDLWNATPLLTVFSTDHSHANGYWRGLINEDAEFKVQKSS